MRVRLSSAVDLGCYGACHLALKKKNASYTTCRRALIFSSLFSNATAVFPPMYRASNVYLAIYAARGGDRDGITDVLHYSECQSLSLMHIGHKAYLSYRSFYSPLMITNCCELENK